MSSATYAIAGIYVDDWQDQVASWHDSRFTDKPLINRVAKVAEEAGELCGAVIKNGEGRRTRQDIIDELGDVIVSAFTVADALDVSLFDTAMSRWVEVRQR